MKKVRMKQTRDENTVTRIISTGLERVTAFVIWSFEFQICFVLRASDFEFEMMDFRKDA
jgi:hypothetical protein